MLLRAALMFVASVQPDRWRLESGSDSRQAAHRIRYLLIAASLAVSGVV